MKPGKLSDKTANIIHGISRVLAWIAAGFAILMMLTIVTNVVGRFVFRTPLPGTIEIVEMLTAAVIFFTLALAEHRRRHIHVELIVSRFPRHTQAILASIMNFFGAAFFIVMGWQAFILMFESMTPLLQASHILSIPEAPFIFAVAFGNLLYGIELLIHVFQPLPPETDKEEVS
ncbi:TRAP transporter small permease [Thermodesulfobacteriota bacterium]